MKLTHLRGSEVLPVKQEVIPAPHKFINTHEDYCEGFNKAVSTIEQVSVEVDCEELARILFENSRKPSVELAKYINESKQKWLKLERLEVKVGKER